MFRRLDLRLCVAPRLHSTWLVTQLVWRKHAASEWGQKAKASQSAGHFDRSTVSTRHIVSLDCFEHLHFLGIHRLHTPVTMRLELPSGALPWLEQPTRRATKQRGVLSIHTPNDESTKRSAGRHACSVDWLPCGLARRAPPAAWIAHTNAPPRMHATAPGWPCMAAAWPQARCCCAHCAASCSVSHFWVSSPPPS